jgi:hypothetical protein
MSTEITGGGGAGVWEVIEKGLAIWIVVVTLRRDDSDGEGLLARQACDIGTSISFAMTRESNRFNTSLNPSPPAPLPGRERGAWVVFSSSLSSRRCVMTTIWVRSF